MRGVERKQLGWQRREDWGSHPQLAHRLETNRFVTDLIAATLADPGMGVSAWYSSRDAAELLETEHLRPDAGFILETQLGAIECWLEWDRGTETAERLKDKLRSYWHAEHHLQLFTQEPRNILFAVPGAGRIETLRRAYAQLQEAEAERVRQDRWAVAFQPSWPILGAIARELRREGPLARVWQRIERDGEPLSALPALPPRRDLAASDLELALGRRWRHQHAGFWERLSPLGRPLPAEAPDEVHTAEAGTTDCPAPSPVNDPEADAFVERLRCSREAELEEARRDNEAANNRRSSRLGAADFASVRRRWSHARPRSEGGAMAITRVCLYSRISTDEDNQPTSLHSQRERLTAFCQAQEDWRVVVHEQDQATGTKLDRPGCSAHLSMRARDASTCCSATASTGSAGRCANSPNSPKNSTGTASSCVRRRSRLTPALPRGG